ncbi:hypothetical protein BDV06DRAFT_208165 [Aspergillus oleicola]
MSSNAEVRLSLLFSCCLPWLFAPLSFFSFSGAFAVSMGGGGSTVDDASGSSLGGLHGDSYGCPRTISIALCDGYQRDGRMHATVDAQTAVLQKHNHKDSRNFSIGSN